MNSALLYIIARLLLLIVKIHAFREFDTEEIKELERMLERTKKG